MTLILLAIGMIVMVFCVIYYSYHTKAKMKMLTQRLQAEQSARLDMAEKAQSLQSEVTILQKKLQHSFEDAVTKLPGWNVFEDRLNQAIKESQRYQFTMGLMFIDIDNFTMIKDGFGYEIGDALLLEVAERLQSCIRQVDSLSRFTKDTFVALLAQLNKPETAAIVAQRIFQAFKAPLHILDHELYITVSIGIAIYPIDAQDAHTLLRNADHALRLAKEKGKHRYQFYQEGLDVKSQRQLVLQTSLGRDTIFQEFSLFYQPIMDVRNSRIFCMDALMHWQHPQVGLVGPAEFYSYAERQHKLNIFSEWLIKAAGKQFLEWCSSGVPVNLLGIPISMRQLESSHFIYQISQILQEIKFQPECLLLELKDNVAFSPSVNFEKAFNMLKYLGVKVAIDNFGADSFALGYLKEMDINFLKLDPNLVQDIEVNKKTVALIQAILSMAEKLSIQVIAQGMQTKAQEQVLKDLGCTLMEGELYGVPIAAKEVINNMAEPLA